jgi:hypothetical protein
MINSCGYRVVLIERDAQVHDQTGERQGLSGRETVQLAHQLDHLDGCDRRRFVQSPAEAERQPAAAEDRLGSFASKATEAVRPCTSAAPLKADVNSRPWRPPLSANC